MLQALTIQVPFLFKHAVDQLSGGPMDPGALALYGTPLTILACYGLARAGAVFFSELKNTVFAKVAQTAIRKVTSQVIQFFLD